MHVAITGARGLVGSALVHELDPARFMVTPLDLPEVNVANYAELQKATTGADALIHLAWKDLIPNVRNDTRDPANMAMVGNVYRVAVENNIRRVIMGSSNQAHGYDVRDPDGRIRPTTKPDAPTKEYGREKLLMEDVGKLIAAEHGTEVICLRIGNVNAGDAPKLLADGPPRWLSKRDLGGLVTACLETEEVPGGFQVLYGVSDGSVFDAVNPFGFVPRDIQ